VTKPDSYILILTARPDGWGTVRLRETAKKRRIKIRTADPSKAMLEVSDGPLPVRFHSRQLSDPSVVIPRPGPGNYENGLMVLAQYEAKGIPVCNSSGSIALAHDTFLSLLKLRQAGIKVPRTMRLLSIKDLKVARKLIGKPPWILKTFTGSMGIGTMLIHETDQLEALAATLWALKQPILLQEFFTSDSATISDVRTLIVGKRILGTIRRTAAVGEFRTNVHRGGSPTPIDLAATERRLAMKAATAIGLDIVGVDWIETENGPVVLEVNATPGFQGFEAATGIDVAKEIVEYASGLSRNRA